MGAAHVDGGTAQRRREKFDIAPLHADGGAEGLESAQVQVDRAVADHASSGERDAGFVLASEQRTQHADGGAHFADEFVRGLGADIFGFDDNSAAGSFHFAAEMAENGEHVMDVAQIGDAANDAFFTGEQGGCEDGQGGVFRSADADRAAEFVSAVNEDFIHESRARNAGYLDNRGGEKCPEICARRGGSRRTRIDPRRFPAEGRRRVSVGRGRYRSVGE